MTLIVKAQTPKQFADAGKLILEYQSYIDSMQFHDCIAGDIMDEIKHLDRVYPTNRGGAFVAYIDKEPVGCIALERQNKSIAEIRRLYVRPSVRGKGLGKKLIAFAVADAKALGYKIVRLDTFRTVDFAANIYRALGFSEIPPYNDLPAEKIVFMEQAL